MHPSVLPARAHVDRCVAWDREPCHSSPFWINFTVVEILCSMIFVNLTKISLIFRNHKDQCVDRNCRVA